MTHWVEGVDISVYQGAIWQSSWDALYAQGQRLAVIGSAHPRPNTFALENLRRAKQAGFILATYAVVYPSVPSAQTVDVAKRMCGEFWPQLSFVGIDCETEGITEAQIFGMETAIRAAELRPLMYTGGWFWKPKMADSQAFNHLPLWTANYRSPPESDSVPLYGGWTKNSLVGHQWAGSVQLAGVTVDRNNFRRDFVQGGQPMPQPPSDADRLHALVLLAEIQKAIAQRRTLTPEQKATLRYFGQP